MSFNPRPGHVTGATGCDWQPMHVVLFQSAPRPRDRGDASPVGLMQSEVSFNPRPGHVTGATRHESNSSRSECVSIRAPAT